MNQRKLIIIVIAAITAITNAYPTYRQTYSFSDDSNEANNEIIPLSVRAKRSPSPISNPVPVYVKYEPEAARRTNRQEYRESHRDLSQNNGDNDNAYDRLVRKETTEISGPGDKEKEEFIKEYLRAEQRNENRYNSRLRNRDDDFSNKVGRGDEIVSSRSSQRRLVADRDADLGFQEDYYSRDRRGRRRGNERFAH